ncbi:OsmC family peroxiredoxin [Lacibacter luteus]|uniref:OsmC family peroxiredoxin n=1 Tax=Lacibacter luteus TaxID=2508719 RepID=A0A4Q1CLR9_9BACT|nr:OsmC family protein [Lacibacter luteus]RXK61946.1 OsmC family peroxiredoxin [Lacibacter luteus]
MASVSSVIKKELYRIEIKSPSGNVVIADEPVSNGGKDAGFAPKELLCSALAACTSATVRMYADRKGWELEEVQVQINLEYITAESRTIINREIRFIGNLDDAQQSRLLAVANACPVHKILSNPIEINTAIV